MTLMVSQYLIWNVGTLKLSMTYGPPIPYMECGNLVTGSPYMYDMIFSGQLRMRSTGCPNKRVISVCDVKNGSQIVYFSHSVGNLTTIVSLSAGS